MNGTPHFSIDEQNYCTLLPQVVSPHSALLSVSTLTHKLDRKHYTLLFVPKFCQGPQRGKSNVFSIYCVCFFFSPKLSTFDRFEKPPNYGCPGVCYLLLWYQH